MQNSTEFGGAFYAKSSLCDLALPIINQDISCCCLSSGTQEWVKNISVFSPCSAATGTHKSARMGELCGGVQSHGPTVQVGSVYST